VFAGKLLDFDVKLEVTTYKAPEARQLNARNERSKG